MTHDARLEKRLEKSSDGCLIYMGFIYMTPYRSSDSLTSADWGGEHVSYVESDQAVRA